MHSPTIETICTVSETRRVICRKLQLFGAHCGRLLLDFLLFSPISLASEKSLGYHAALLVRRVMLRRLIEQKDGHSDANKPYTTTMPR